MRRGHQIGGQSFALRCLGASENELSVFKNQIGPLYMPGTPTASASIVYRGSGPKVTLDRHVPESDKVP
jgi:hypothetical protein